MTAPPPLRRMIRAFVASVATGLVVRLLVTRAALPALARGVTPEQVEWLRRAFIPLFLSRAC